MVTKEDGWRTEILDLFIHRTGGKRGFRSFPSGENIYIGDKKNTRRSEINVTLWVKCNASQRTTCYFQFYNSSPAP